MAAGGASVASSATSEFLNSLCAQSFGIRADCRKFVASCSAFSTEFELIRTDTEPGVLGSVQLLGSTITLVDPKGAKVGEANFDSCDPQIASSLTIFDCPNNVEASVTQEGVTFVQTCGPCLSNLIIIRPSIINDTTKSIFRLFDSSEVASLYRQESAIVISPGKSIFKYAVGCILVAAIREYFYTYKMYLTTPLPTDMMEKCLSPPVPVPEMVIRASCRDQFTMNQNGTPSFGRVHAEIFTLNKENRLLYVVEVMSHQIKFNNQQGCTPFYCKRSECSNMITVHGYDGEEVGSYSMSSRNDPTSVGLIPGLSTPYFHVKALPPSVYVSRDDQINCQMKSNLLVVSAFDNCRTLCKIVFENYVVRVSLSEELNENSFKTLLMAFCTNLALFYFKLPGQLIPPQTLQVQI
ncbi:hypothetical protein EB796_015290 [Bugula neritina]|uniref:Uncharacterized protein n=1 Tax=Bugula neritina TaxID=10212 RepID=A0A7J7JJ89_BUGNE|nr:hypothetical protein EB796_015290 [Bugula neritina]